MKLKEIGTAILATTLAFATPLIEENKTLLSDLISEGESLEKGTSLSVLISEGENLEKGTLLSDLISEGEDLQEGLTIEELKERNK